MNIAFSEKYEEYDIRFILFIFFAVPGIYALFYFNYVSLWGIRFSETWLYPRRTDILPELKLACPFLLQC
jgi:hypothetical protein